MFENKINDLITKYTGQFKGRKKIIIDASYDDFIANPTKVIAENMGDIEAIQSKNAAEMKYLYQFANGIQDILSKMRKDGETQINNISVTNYAHEIIEFKKGFEVGQPIKYVNSSEERFDDMKYLNKYIKNVSKSSKDLDKYENAFITGVAYTFTIPKKSSYDSEKESPFDYNVISNYDTSMVYSSDMISQPLFSLFRTNTINNQKVNVTTYTAYFNYTCIVFRQKNANEIEIISTSAMPILQPITEYSLNKSRMGVFEPIISNLNCLNTIRSNQLDNIEQFINAYMVFLNQNPEYINEHINEFRKNRAIALKTNNPQAPADIKILQNSLNHGEINDFYESQKIDAFNIVGVPMATSNTGQGVSGEAQTYGGGWENAQTIAQLETSYMEQFEREDLKKFLYISNNGVEPKLENIDENDIDIKYTINMSNNILTKMQSLKYWVDAGFSLESGLEITGLTKDSHAVGISNEEHAKEKKIENLKIENEYSNQNQTKTTDTKVG